MLSTTLIIDVYDVKEYLPALPRSFSAADCCITAKNKNILLALFIIKFDLRYRSKRMPNYFVKGSITVHMSTSRLTELDPTKQVNPKQTNWRSVVQ